MKKTMVSLQASPTKILPRPRLILRAHLSPFPPLRTPATQATKWLNASFLFLRMNYVKNV